MQPTGAPPGRVIADRYRLTGLLGRGGMADVYDAYDERLARPVALKVLRAAHGGGEGTRARFEQEARSAARLSHPSVVAVYDSGEDGNDAFLVMERLPGETLADRMRSGPVDPGWLREVAVDVLSALEAAHAQGLVHRDIKPANILIADDGRAKVADFGIAKAVREDDGMPAGEDMTSAMVHDLTATGMVLGTVAYLSPEQIEGSAASPRSDLYALGVVLYEALAGHKPYVGSTPVAQARAAAAGGAPDITSVRADVPADLAAVIRRSMAHDPADRYPSAAAMRADLQHGTAVAAPTLAASAVAATRAMPLGAAQAVAAGATQVLPTRPPPTGVPAGPLEAPRAGRARWVVLALLAVLIVAVIAILLATSSPPTRKGPTTTTTTKPVSVSAQVRELRAQARYFRSIGTPGADTVAQMLDALAALPASQRAAQATADAQDVATLYAGHELTTAQYDRAISVLESVGAKAPSTTTTTGTSPSTTTKPATHGKGHGHGPGGPPGHGPGTTTPTTPPTTPTTTPTTPPTTPTTQPTTTTTTPTTTTTTSAAGSSGNSGAPTGPPGHK